MEKNKKIVKNGEVLARHIIFFLMQKKEKNLIIGQDILLKESMALWTSIMGQTK